VDEGDAFHPGGKSSALAVRLRERLPDGTYTATYRIISADGHPVSGGLVFTFGKPSARLGASVSELLERRGGTGAVTKVGFGVARGLQYAAIALALGTGFFLTVIWLPGLGLVAGAGREWREASQAFVHRLRTLLIATAATGVASALLGIVFQGATGAGTSFWSALDPDIWREVLETRFGTIWGLRVLVWLAVGALVAATFSAGRRLVLQPASLGAAGLVLQPRARIPVLALLALPLGFLVLSVALSGHASLQSPTGLLVPANVVHVSAVSIWAGGLALLVLALPAATRSLERPDRTRLLAAILARFSTVAFVAAAALLASGLTQAIAEVRTLENVTGTAFGRAVLIKFCLFLGLIAIGAYNRRRMVPRLAQLAAEGGPPGRSGMLVRRALRAEVALVVAVLGVTAALVSYPPSVAESSGPVSVSRSLGPADLQLTVDPARVGPNEVHFYLTNKRDGSPFERVKEFTVKLALPDKQIGPIAQRTRRVVPGHYVMDGAVFGAAGDWRVEVAARVSAFDAYYADLDVPID
jgi:copper transport protein